MVDEAWRAECALLGIDPLRLLPAGVQAMGQVPDHELWPEHGPAWRVFLGCQTQWRCTRNPFNGRVLWEGLLYPGVEVVMARAGVAVEDQDRVFGEVQVLEDEFLTIKARQ